MRPGCLESLRGVQAAIAEAILSEPASAYAQEMAGTLQMLIESIAAEWDGKAQELNEDNSRMSELLAGALPDLRPFAKGNESVSALVREIEESVTDSGVASLSIAVLTAENDRLRGQLERLTVTLEDAAPDPRYAPLMGLRTAVYGHLRRVAASGWSFWDVASFRERMAALKSDISG